MGIGVLVTASTKPMRRSGLQMRRNTRRAHMRPHTISIGLQTCSSSVGISFLQRRPYVWYGSFAVAAMSRQKLRVHRTETENLVSNLRGEIGEIITSWILLHDLMIQDQRERTGDPERDLAAVHLIPLRILGDRLEDDIVARLSELAEKKVGRLTFHFASLKLGMLDAEAKAFAQFIDSRRFREKRNQHISHKELPERFSDHRLIHIPYFTLLRGVALALRIMKKIDRIILGPASNYLWREMRKRRYKPTGPPRVGYMLLPYLGLSAEERVRIVLEEHREGRCIWSDMPTRINGHPVHVKACKPWGVVALGNRFLTIETYPLIELHDINLPIIGATEATEGE